MTKYRIRLGSGRVIGSFVKNQLFDLKAKGHIKGSEEAQIFPTGNWGPITTFDFYPELMDENKTVVELPTIKWTRIGKTTLSTQGLHFIFVGTKFSRRT